MKPSRDIRSISHLKAHAAELIREIHEGQRTVIITQKGEAKVAMMDIHVYEELQESLALLQMIAQSRRSLSRGRGVPLEQAFRQVRDRVKSNEAAVSRRSVA